MHEMGPWSHFLWNLSYEDCLNRAGTCHILAIVAKRRLRFWQKCGGALDVVPHARCWANAVVKDLLWFHLSSGKTPVVSGGLECVVPYLLSFCLFGSVG